MCIVKIWTVYGHNILLSILTSIWSAQHPNAGRNIQQVPLSKTYGVRKYLWRTMLMIDKHIDWTFVTCLRLFNMISSRSVTTSVTIQPSSRWRVTTGSSNGPHSHVDFTWHMWWRRSGRRPTRKERRKERFPRFWLVGNIYKIPINENHPHLTLWSGTQTFMQIVYLLNLLKEKLECNE